MMKESDNNPDLDVDAMMTEIRRSAQNGSTADDSRRLPPGIQGPASDAPAAQLQLNSSFVLALEEALRAIKGLESRQDALNHRLALQSDRHTIAELAGASAPINPSGFSAAPDRSETAENDRGTSDPERSESQGTEGSGERTISERTGTLLDISRDQLTMLAAGLAETAMRFSAVKGGLTELQSAVEEVAQRLTDPASGASPPVVADAAPAPEELPAQDPPDDRDRVALELSERLGVLERGMAEIVPEMRDRLAKLQAGLAGIENRIAGMEAGAVETAMRVSTIEAGKAENESRMIAVESSVLSALKLAEDRTSSSIEGLTKKLETGLRETAMRVSMIEGGLAENESRIIAAESGMLSALNLAEDRTRSSIEGLTQKLEAGQRETALRIGTAEGGLGEIESRISAAEARLALDRAEAARLAAEVNRVESETKKAIAVHLQEQTRAMDEMQIRMLRMERRIRPQIPEDDVTDGAAEKGAAAPASKAGGNDPDENRADPMRGFDYFMFELRFRGSTEEVKRKQAPYLGLFLGRKNVIDLGCGRGEFLELMKENHVPAVGVDMNPDMVDYCRLRRLRVVLGDMMTHLAAQPDESIDGIFVSQVVEHLTPSAVMDLIELCGNKMTDGGVIVVETINPSCFEAMLNFYTDPTHVRPIPAGLLRFMFEQGRFKVESVLFNAPINPEKMAVQLVATGAFPAEAGSYLDYAVHAVKR